LSGALSQDRSLYFSTYIIVLCIFLMYFYFQGDYISFALASALLIIHFFVKLLLSGEASYIWVGFVFVFVGFYCAYDYFLWHSQIKLSLEKRDRSSEEIQKLKERFESKEESVRRLEQQVMDIVRLFEIAKEFNECLVNKDLAEVILQKVLPSVPFARGTLILMNENNAPLATYQVGSHVSGIRTVDEVIENSMEVRIISYLEKDPKPIRWESAGDVTIDLGLNDDTEFPFWVFPLFVEGKMIAAFVIENADIDDYPKFEIVSAQLAMQVKKVRLYESVKELSIIDGLTQVFVRRHFLERFSEEFKRSIRHHFNLCVLMLDIDHFKIYNDTYGHLVGDMTLREVANLIKETVRKVDIIARYGGEEFVIVLPETSKKAAFEVAERIRSAIAKKRFRVYDEDTQVTVSIGISTFPEDLVKEITQDLIQSGMLELLTQADQALYQAKEEGRNRVFMFNA